MTTQTLWIVVAHVAWVVGASISRSENLLLSMVTGQRHAAPPLPSRPVVPPASTKTAPTGETSDAPPAEEPRRERGGGRARRKEAGGGGGRRRRERD